MSDGVVKPYEAMDRLTEALPTYDNMVVLRTEAMNVLTPNGFKVLSQMERAVLAYRDLLANGQRVEPDYEAAAEVIAQALGQVLHDGHETKGACAACRLIAKHAVDAAIGSMLLVNLEEEK